MKTKAIKREGCEHGYWRPNCQMCADKILIKKLRSLICRLQKQVFDLKKLATADTKESEK